MPRGRQPYKLTKLAPTVVKMYKSGAKLADIRKATGLCYRTIYKAVKQAGLPRNRREKIVHHRGDILKMISAGNVDRQIAKATGLNYKTIYRFRAMNGLSFREYKLGKHDKTIRTMLSKGTAIQEIANMFSVHVKSVYKYCRIHGYKRTRVSDKTKQLIIELAGQAEPWPTIVTTTGIRLYTAKKILREAGLFPKPRNVYIPSPREPVDEEVWFPPTDAPDYGDDFQLKPEHRARLEEIKQIRFEKNKRRRKAFK